MTGRLGAKVAETFFGDGGPIRQIGSEAVERLVPSATKADVPLHVKTVVIDRGLLEMPAVVDPNLPPFAIVTPHARASFEALLGRLESFGRTANPPQGHYLG